MFKNTDKFLTKEAVPDAALLSKLALECAQVFQSAWQYQKLEDSLAVAKEASGTDLKLTGIMEKRTKFQKDEKTQQSCLDL